MAVHIVADRLPLCVVGLCEITKADEPSVPRGIEDRAVCLFQIKLISHG